MPKISTNWMAAIAFCVFLFASCDRREDDLPADLVPPEAPAVLSPIEGGTTNQCIAVVWSAVDYAGSYEVQLATDALFSENGSRLFSATVASNLDSHIFEHLEPGPLFVRVKAANSAGESDWSPVVGFNVAIDVAFPCFDPPAMVALEVPPHEEQIAGVYDITFEWGTAEEATHYQLQIAWEVGSTIQAWVYDNGSIAGTERTVQDFEPGKTYVWRVRAFTYSAAGAWSSFRRFTVVD